MTGKMSSTRKIVVISSICSIVLFIGSLAFILHWLNPSPLQYQKFAQQVTISDPEKITDPFTSHIIGELVKNGTLISLKDVWSFQSAFYQTIITFLIAINGLLAGLAVVYIRSSSHEKAEDAANSTVDAYIQSDSFKHLINEKVELLIAESRNDFNTSADKLDVALDRIENAVEEVSYCGIEVDEIRKQIEIISTKVAKLDSTDTDGGDFELAKPEVD